MPFFTLTVPLDSERAGWRAWSAGVATTVYLCVVVAALPELSPAVTEYSCCPTVDVSMYAPTGVVPSHRAMPVPPASSRHS